VRIARSFGSFSVERFGKRFYDDLNYAYPDVNYFRGEFLRMQQGGVSAWAQGTGAVDYMLTQCGADVVRNQPACQQLRRTLDNNKLVAAIQDTFGMGTFDPRTQAEKEAAVIDLEVAAKLKALQEATIRYQKLEKEAQCIRIQCQVALTGTSASPLDPDCPAMQLKTDAASCDQMAAYANVRAYEEQVRANKEQLEVQRLQALQLAAHNAQLKRDIRDTAAQRAAVNADIVNIARDIQIQTDATGDSSP
jgi:leucyl aminopeptidase